MSLIFLIYLAGISGKLGFILFAIGACSMLITTALTDEENLKSLPRKLGFIVGVIIIFLSALIPNKDTIHLMIAAYGGQYLVSNEQVSQVGSKSLSVLDKMLSEYLDEDTGGK